MKNLIIIFLLCSSFGSLSGQVDISIAPISTITFGRINVSAEVPIVNNLGFQGSLLYSSGSFLGMNSDDFVGFGYEAFLKYYMVDNSNHDKFYIGMYSRNLGTESRGGFRYGFNLGYKVVSKHNVFCELNTGAGIRIIKADSSPILSAINETDTATIPDVYFKASIGYRFGSKEI